MGNDRPGWIVESKYQSPIETPAGYLARRETMSLYCRRPLCRHQGTVIWEDLIDRGWGDIPINAFRHRWKCQACGWQDVQTVRSGTTDSGANYVPRPPAKTVPVRPAHLGPLILAAQGTTP